MPEVEDTLHEVVALLVDRPEDVEVSALPEERGVVVLELRVAPDDLGKVIGRQGRTAHALRTLLDARGTRRGVDYELDILED